MAALQAQVFDVCAGGLGDAQPVEGEQGDQRVLGGRPSPRQRGGSELVAVQGGGVRLVIQPGAADVGGGRVVEEFLFHGVLVEPGDRERLRDGRAGPA